MATLGSDKLTGIRDVDGNDSVPSKRYLDNSSPDPGGVTKSYLKAEKKSFSTWVQRTMNIVPPASDYLPQYTGVYGFIYSEKDDILLSSGYWTSNKPNYVCASTDAVHWALRTIPIPTAGTYYAIQGLNYANGIYFATGNSYNNWVSTDTVTWIARTSPRQNTNTNGTSTGNTNVLYGYSGTVGANVYCQITYADTLTTTDTIHWTLRTKVGGSASQYYFRDGLYRDGYFMGVGGNSDNYMIQASTDAIHWKLRTFGTAPVGSGLFFIQYLDLIGKYCALGYDHYGLSTDAIHWTAYNNVDGQISLTPLIYDNDFKTKKYYTTKHKSNTNSNNKVYSTTDAINWIGEVVFSTNSEYASNAYSLFNKPGGGFIRPQDGTLYYVSEIETKTYASETSLESPKGTVLLRPDRLNAGYSNKLYFPKGTGTVLIEWTSGSKGGNRGNPNSTSGQSNNSSPLYKGIYKLDPSYDRPYLSYSIGDVNYETGGAYYAAMKYAYSDSWIDVGHSSYQQTQLSQPYASALGLNSSFVETYLLAHSGGGLQSSIGSITDWAKRTCSITGSIYAAHNYDSKFLIGNTTGNIASSTDTIRWTKRTLPAATGVFEIKDWNNMWRIFYGTNRYAASTDAIIWSQRTVGDQNFQIYSGAYDSSTGISILVGGSRKVASSTDDIHWTMRTVASSYSTSTYYRAALSNNNGLFVIAGTYGDTQKSTDGIIWTYIDWTSKLGFSRDGRDDSNSGSVTNYDSSEYFDGKFHFSMSDYPGYSNRYYTVVSSTDAIHWAHENFGDNHANYLYDISYSDNLKTILWAGSTVSGPNSQVDTSWYLYGSAGTSSIAYGRINNNEYGVSKYYDYGVESSYNAGYFVSGVSGVNDGNPGSVMQYDALQPNTQYSKSEHGDFFISTGGSGASKIGNGGSLSKKYYGTTQTVSGGVGSSTIFNLSVTNNGSGNYVISGTDQTTTHNSANNPTITVKSGNILVFTVNAIGHPFLIKKVQSTGFLNSLPDYVVKGNGGQGTNSKVIFNTSGLSAGTYYYNCQYHSSMKGTINVTAATSSINGSDGTSTDFSGGRFGMGGGGGGAFEQSPNFWTRLGKSEGFPDSNVFGSSIRYARFEYDSHYNFWVYSGFDGSPGKFAVSTDVIHWVLRTVGAPDGTHGFMATNGSGTYVIQSEGNDGIITSTDTIHWTHRTSPQTNDAQGIAYHNGNYIAQFSYNTIGSTDGTIWTYRTTGTGSSAYLDRWAVGNGYIIGLGDGFAEAAVSSTDTIHWGRRTVSTKYGYYTYGLGFAGGLFHASDGQGYGSYNVSTDSIHWTLRTMGNQVRFNTDNAVKYGTYRGSTVYMTSSNNSSTLIYSTDTVHWSPSDKITLNSAGGSTVYGMGSVGTRNGDWYYANYNGESPDGVINRARAFYEPGGDEVFIVGNGGHAGPGCSGGGGGTTSKFSGIGGLGGPGYIQVTWW